MNRLLRIEAPHFVAGMEFTRTDAGRWRVTRSAPILAYMKDWSPERIKAYLQLKGWTWEWNLRKQREQWRKGEERAAQDRMARERLEREKSFLLIALSAFDTDQDILRQFVTTKNQLNVMTTERDQLKERNEYAIQRMIEVQRENLQLSIENAQLRFNNKVTYREINSSTSSFTKEMWRRFTQLCHPDKHDGSIAATEATRWLLENRP